MKTLKATGILTALGLLGLSLLALPLAAAEPVDTPANGEFTNYDLKNFDGIEASGGVQVVLKQDKVWTVQSSGSGDALDSLDIRVRGRNLLIGFKPHFGLAWGSPVQVLVTMPELTRLKLSGASGMTIRFDARHSPRLAFDLSGGAGLQGVLLASVISGEVSGGSSLKIEGYADSAVIDVNGGSRVESADFAVDNATFALSGGSFAAMAAQSNITVKASGGSHLDYRGAPAIRQQLSGGASIRQIK